jgi:hypothetical protein
MKTGKKLNREYQQGKFREILDLKPKESLVVVFYEKGIKKVKLLKCIKEDYCNEKTY